MDQPPAVSWREAGVEPPLVHPLLEAPGDNRGFQEKGRYLFRKPPGNWTLHVDDEPLTTAVEAQSLWAWEPRFFAGEVTAELCRADGRRAALFLLDVAPDPSKLGRDDIAMMIRELLAEEPSLVLGTEPATFPIGHLGRSENAWLALARLRRYAPDFLRAVERVCARPRRTLRVRRESAALHRVRRIDRQTVLGILRGPARALAGGDPNRHAARDARLDVPSVEESVDSSANRAMLAMLRALSARSKELLRCLSYEVRRTTESDTTTPLAARWPRRRYFLESLIARLDHVSRKTPFSAASRAEVTAAGLTAVASDATYAWAWGRGWRALRRGVGGTDVVDRMWTSPTWEIYERWCFMRLGKLLTEHFPGWNWRRRTDPDRWEGACTAGHATLVLQPTFRNSQTEIARPWSISKERIPDLVLTVAADGAERFVVFDAKYRTSRANMLDAMQSAHIYQDSLRIASKRPERTLLLVPRTDDAPWLATSTFIDAHRVGIHAMHIGDGELGLPAIVGDLLG